MKLFIKINEIINERIYNSEVTKLYNFYSENREFVVRSNYKRLMNLAKEIVVGYENEIEELIMVNVFLNNEMLRKWLANHRFNLIYNNRDMLDEISNFNKESDNDLTMINFAKSLIKVNNYLNKLIDKYSDEEVYEDETYSDYLDIDDLLNKTFWYWNGDVYKCIYNKRTLLKALQEMYDDLSSNNLLI